MLEGQNIVKQPLQQRSFCHADAEIPGDPAISLATGGVAAPRRYGSSVSEMTRTNQRMIRSALRRW